MGNLGRGLGILPDQKGDAELGYFSNAAILHEVQDGVRRTTASAGTHCLGDFIGFALEHERGEGLDGKAI